MKERIANQRNLMRVISMLAILSSFTSIYLYSQSAVPYNSNNVAINLTGGGESKELKVGDQVPNITFNNVLNYNRNKIRLSDFNGKMVILDMWSVTCGSCIALFPKMEKLQEEFKDKIQVLLVNPHDPKYNSEVMVRKVLNDHKKRTGYFPSLPLPIQDSLLNLYFPHQSVPHYVIIDSIGTIVAITGTNGITSANIKALLEGREVNVPTKNDWSFDKSKPLFVDDNGGTHEKMIFRSLFSEYIPGVRVTTGIRKNEKREITGVYILNRSLSELIHYAFSDIIYSVDKSRIVLNVNSPERFKQEFDAANIYCYDLSIPPMTSKFFDYRKFLSEDLRRVFNISVRKENQLVKCLILKSTNRLESTHTRFKTAEIELRNSSLKKFIRNSSQSEVINALKPFILMPVIDETNEMEKKIDVDFPDNFDLTNTQSILFILRKVGFELKIEEREIEVVVISDK